MGSIWGSTLGNYQFKFTAVFGVDAERFRVRGPVRGFRVEGSKCQAEGVFLKSQRKNLEVTRVWFFLREARGLVDTKESPINASRERHAGKPSRANVDP